MLRDMFNTRWYDGLTDMDEYIALFDEGLLKIRTGEGVKALEVALEQETYTRSIIESLYVAGMFADLPVEAQLHPEMQARVQTAMPVMDEAAARVMARIDAMDDMEMGRLAEAMRSPANPAMRVAQYIDAKAGLCHVSPSRRVKTRTMFNVIESRMRTQPPALFLDEVVSRSRKLIQRSNAPGSTERLLLARVGQQEYEATIAHYEAVTLYWGQRCKAIHPNWGRGVASAGGIIMGLGSMSLLSGGIILSEVSLLGAGMLTVGGLLFLAGLIIVCVGIAFSNKISSK